MTAALDCYHSGISSILRWREQKTLLRSLLSEMALVETASHTERPGRRRVPWCSQSAQLYVWKVVLGCAVKVSKPNNTVIASGFAQSTSIRTGCRGWELSFQRRKPGCLFPAGNGQGAAELLYVLLLFRGGAVRSSWWHCCKREIRI